MPEMQDLAAVLKSVATPGMKPKDLIAAVCKQHPDVSKKEIVRAAFYTLTDGVAGDAEQAQQLHAFALRERAAEDDDGPVPRKLRKKDRRRQQPVQCSTH